MKRLEARHALLFLIGAALSIAQFVMIRDFVSILYGEEVVIVLVTASFFVGLSVGYLLSLRLTDTQFRVLFVLSAFAHLTFPFSYRYLAAGFAMIDLGGYAYLALLFGYALVFNTIFATFLPRMISLGPEEEGGSELERMKTYYALELAGFMSGFGVVALSWNHPLGALLAGYWLILGVILYLALRLVSVTVVYAALAIAAVTVLPDLDRHSTALLYEHKHSIRDPQVLYSINSPYQKVEVIEDARGTRYLYLDGLLNLNSTDLDSLNYYIAEIPARLIRPERALLIGNGTLSSVPRVYPHAGEVTSVELDGGVLEAGRRHFTDPESLAGLERWSLHVDDGKHFLRGASEPFDLIIMDVPSPLTIQEAYLHTVEFYRLAAERMPPEGVIAVQLSGPLSRNDRTPARVTAALAEVFDDVMVIYSERADRGFAYAAMTLPFTGEDLRAAAADYEAEIELIEPEEVGGYLVEATPMSVNAMDLVLRRGWERFTDRYFDE